MSTRRWLALIASVVVIVVGITVYVLPELVRQVATSRIHTLTRRPVSIERIELSLLAGRATVHGFRLTERDGRTPFAEFKRLDVRLRLPSLLIGHLWLRDLVLTDSTVRVVRLPTGEFNFSDLIEQSGSRGRALDVTVDHFALLGGTVSLEDRALPEPRTWRSEQITIEADNISTRRDDGHAVGRSVTAGAPASVEVTNLRLYPIRLHATVTLEGVDLTPAQVYLPPGAPVVLARGRMSTSISVMLDAREGLRADATARVEDVAVVRRDGGEPLALVPSLTSQVSGFAFREGPNVRLAQLAVDGTVSVRDPRPKEGMRFRNSMVRANIADFTWPATAPGRLNILTTTPGSGTLALTGAIQPPPSPSHLRLRLANLDLASWSQFLPVAARVTGVAEADLRMSEPLDAGIPSRLQGSIAVNRLGVADDRHELLGARRVAASGLEIHWPSRVIIGQLLVSGPRGRLERDRTGALPVTDLFARATPSSTPATQSNRSPRYAAAAALGIEITDIVVRQGAMTWLDETVSPAARLEVSNINGSVTGIGWPLRGPAGVRMALRPPGGGHVQVTGRIGLDPFWAEVQLRGKDADLAPYQSYLPTTARIAGSASVDMAVVVPSLAEGRATARGNAALSHVDVRDGQRTVMRVEQANVTAAVVQWPERIAVGHLTFVRPWVVVERDEKGQLPLRTLLRPPEPSTKAASSTADTSRVAPTVTVTELSVEGGGMRVVDRAVSPAFALDFQPITLRVQGASTASDRPAHVDLRGSAGPGAEVALRGTLGALGGPLRFDITGEIRDFAVPRANPYVLQQAGWKTIEGRLTSNVHARVAGDALSAKTDIRVSRLQLVRAAPEDGAEARIGLPLNMLSALMKDKRGDITLSFPVGGRLSDPRFDFSEAIWGAIRTVAVNAITLPVSWVGRVRFTPDSRIERIEVDPVAFQPGVSALMADGQAQATRLAGFLDQVPEVRMTLTPVISSDDIIAIKRRMVESAVERVARESRLSRDAAAARVFEQTDAGRPAPASLEATLDALVERQSVPPPTIAKLAADRVDALRSMLKEAGIDPSRLAETEAVQREADGRIELNVVAPETERASKLRDVLRRLGVPLGKE